MGYAIIRNTKYKINNLNAIFRHNERKNTNYSNTNINKEKSKYNYSIKTCPTAYTKRLLDIKKQYNLKGQMKKTNNVACEYIITSSNDFFEELGADETKRFFECSYKFVSQYQNLGEEFILSARVHMDETTPHMHLVFLPVVRKIDSKTNEPILKLSCSEFWYGKNSYKKLQDSFYSYITRCGFNLERGQSIENKHIDIKELKLVTNHEEQEFLNKSSTLEKELQISNSKLIEQNYKRVIKKFNTLAKQYNKIQSINNSHLKVIQDLNTSCNSLKEENKQLKKKNKRILNYLIKTLDCVSQLLDWPVSKLKEYIDNYITSEKEAQNERSNRDRI